MGCGCALVSPAPPRAGADRAPSATQCVPLGGENIVPGPKPRALTHPRHLGRGGWAGPLVRGDGAREQGKGPGVWPVHSSQPQQHIKGYFHSNRCSVIKPGLSQLG